MFAALLHVDTDGQLHQLQRAFDEGDEEVAFEAALDLREARACT